MGPEIRCMGSSLSGLVWSAVANVCAYLQILNQDQISAISTNFALQDLTSPAIAESAASCGVSQVHADCHGFDSAAVSCSFHDFLVPAMPLLKSKQNPCGSSNDSLSAKQVYQYSFSLFGTATRQGCLFGSIIPRTKPARLRLSPMTVIRGQKGWRQRGVVADRFQKRLGVPDQLAEASFGPLRFQKYTSD